MMNIREITHPIGYLPLTCKRLRPVPYGFSSLNHMRQTQLTPAGTCLRITTAFYHWIESFQCRLCSSFNPAHPDPLSPYQNAVRVNRRVYLISDTPLLFIGNQDLDGLTRPVGEQDGRCAEVFDDFDGRGDFASTG